MARGDHIFVLRTSPIPFQHHGVDLGDGTVIHFTDGDDGVANPLGDFSCFEIRRTSMACFVGPNSPSIQVQSHNTQIAAEDICQRAISRVGETGYDLVHFNCEHFASWCVTGVAESRQVSIAVERGSSVGMKAAAACGVRLATRLGVRSSVRRLSPWLVVADAAQFATESCGQYVGLTNPRHRQVAGRIVGGTTAVAVGIAGGVPMVVANGAIWAASEVAAEASRRMLGNASDERRDEKRDERRGLCGNQNR